jgi:hypothetical protein
MLSKLPSSVTARSHDDRDRRYSERKEGILERKEKKDKREYLRKIKR